MFTCPQFGYHSDDYLVLLQQHSLAFQPWINPSNPQDLCPIFIVEGEASNLPMFMVGAHKSNNLVCIIGHHMVIVDHTLIYLKSPGTIGQDKVKLPHCTISQVVFKTSEPNNRSPISPLFRNYGLSWKLKFCCSAALIVSLASNNL